MVKEVANIRYFSPFMPSGLSVFKPGTCILHHIAFLFCLPAHYFSPPVTPFSPLKTYFLAVVLPFLAMFFMTLKGFVYTIMVDVYAFRPALSVVLNCILPHFTLRFAPKRTPFSTKTQGILHQNTHYLAAKRTEFSCK